MFQIAVPSVLHQSTSPRAAQPITLCLRCMQAATHFSDFRTIWQLSLIHIFTRLQEVSINVTIIIITIYDTIFFIINLLFSQQLQNPVDLKLCFYHPVTGELMQFETPYPNDFKKLFLKK